MWVLGAIEAGLQLGPGDTGEGGVGEEGEGFLHQKDPDSSFIP